MYTKVKIAQKSEFVIEHTMEIINLKNNKNEVINK